MPKTYGPDDFTRAYRKLFEDANEPDSGPIINRANNFSPAIKITASLLTEWKQGSVPRDENVVVFLVRYLGSLAGRKVTDADLKSWKELRAGSERARRRARQRRGRAAGAPPRLTDAQPNDGQNATTDRSYTAAKETVHTADFVSHWDPVARGVSAITPGTGWYFTGRSAVLRKLIEWLAQPAAIGGNGLIVTGDPGVGKSALLARLVTLSDAAYRARFPHAASDAEPGTVPPVGLINVALYARGLTLLEVSTRLAIGCEVPSGTPEQVWRSIVARQRPLRIVIDALDEATGGDDIARNLVRPLARHGGHAGIRVLVGVRRQLLAPLGTAFQVLDLATSADPDSALVNPTNDVARYVIRLLQAAPDGPYLNQPRFAAHVGTVVADRARNNYLVAQLAADYLVGAPVDVASIDWIDHLPASVNDAMEEYLARFKADSARVRDLLRALAYAQVDGLAPGAIWLAIANAVSFPRHYDMVDLGWLLEHARDYLIQDAWQDATSAPAHYRLFHQALADYLTRTPDYQHHQSAIVDALTLQVPSAEGSPDWMSADPYLRRGLAAHAASCGRLGELVEQPRFLLAAERTRLNLAFANSDDLGVHRVAQVYRRALPRLSGRTVGEAASWLQLNAQQFGLSSLSDRITNDLVLPWSVLWSRVRTAAEQVLSEDVPSTKGIRLTTVDSKPIAVSVHGDGTACIWNLRTGVVEQQLAPHQGHIMSLELGDVWGIPVMVTAGLDDNVVRIWDLRQLSLIADIETPGVLYASLGQVAGRPVVIINADVADGYELRIADVSSASVDQVFPLKQFTRAAAIIEIRGDELLVCAVNDNKAIRAWRLSDGVEILELCDGPSGVSEARLGLLNGKPVLAWGQASVSGRAGVWDLAQRAPIIDVDASPQGLGGVRAVDIGTLDGSPVLVSGGGNDGVVRVWSLDGRQRVAFEGHDNVDAVAVGQVDQRGVVLSAGRNLYSESIRMWELPASSTNDSGPMHAGAVAGLGRYEIDGRPVLLSFDPGADASIQVRGLEDGALLHMRPGHRFATHCARLLTVGGHMNVISFGSDDLKRGSVRMHDIGRPDAIAQFDVARSGYCADCGMLDGRPAIAIADSASTVRLFALPGGQLLGEFGAEYGTVGHIAMVFDDNVGSFLIFAAAMTHMAGALVPDGRVYVQQIPSGRRIGAFNAHRFSILDIAGAMIAGQPIIATCGGAGVHIYDVVVPGDNMLKLWTLEGQSIGSFWHPEPVIRVALGDLARRHMAVSGMIDGTVYGWDIDSHKEVFRVQMESRISSLAIVDTDLLAIGTQLGVTVVELHLE